jgi:hypothetical protein
MHGQDPMERKYCIAGQNQHWSGLENENQGDMGYDEADITIHRGNCGTEWKNSLIEGQEYGFVYSHSGQTMHEIGFNISGQYSNDLDCRFFNSFACYNALITTANMCGAYATSNQGLICVGSSKSGSMCPGTFRAYNRPLGEGKSFGEAFLDWFNDEGIDNASWHYGMHLQGAGTLLLKPYASGPYLAVTSPNGGEELEQFTTHTITWGSNVSGNVKVELFKGGALNKTLAASIANSGSLEWIITTDFVVGDDYKIKITSLENDTCIDESNDNFSIIEERIFGVPYHQDFNNWSRRSTTDYWEQSDDDDINWTILSGPTPSREGGYTTGPEGDFPNGSGQYIYIEASGSNYPSKKASIVTPKFNFQNVSAAKLRLYYHMYSGEQVMGDFFVDVQVGKDAAWEESKISLTGNDYGDNWIEQQLDLNFIVSGNYTAEQKKRVRFRLRGITSDDSDEGWSSDISVDSFSIDNVSTSIIGSPANMTSFGLQYHKSHIQYRIPDFHNKVHVNIKLYNIQGKLIKTLVDKAQSSGNYFVKLNSSQHKLAAGVYMCKMEVAGFQRTVKIVNK